MAWQTFPCQLDLWSRTGAGLEQAVYRASSVFKSALPDGRPAQNSLSGEPKSATVNAKLSECSIRLIFYLFLHPPTRCWKARDIKEVYESSVVHSMPFIFSILLRIPAKDCTNIYLCSLRIPLKMSFTCITAELDNILTSYIVKIIYYKICIYRMYCVYLHIQHEEIHVFN